MNPSRRILWVAILATSLLVLLAGCGGGSGAPKVDWKVKISGAVSEPLEVTYAELAQMPQIDLNDILMQKSTGEDETHSFTGTSLAEVLKKAGVNDTPAAITALASDGYAVEISQDELQDAIIALKQDGEWIADDKDHGPIRLVCPHTPANRWVFQVVEIQVQ